MAEGVSSGTGTSGDPFTSGDTGAEGEPDYYAALGVPLHASDDEIRRAYHRLAKLWHPDRYMAAPPALRARAERRMRALTAAYGALGDSASRHAYDQRRGYATVGTVIAPTPTGADAPHQRAAATVHHDPAYAGVSHSPPGQQGDFNGIGHFLGGVCAFLALGLLTRTLRGGAYGAGMYLALGGFVVLARLSLWFFTDDSTPARWASRVLEGERRGVTNSPHSSRARHTTHRESHRDAGKEPTEFERLVDAALADVPPEFRPYLENVVVQVKPEPSEEERASVGLKEGWTLFGLYHGVSLTHQHVGGAGPEEITIYQGPIERYCHGDPERMRKQVRKTVLHELAHHFGIDHEEMPESVR